jgi:hypothetical protein
LASQRATAAIRSLLLARVVEEKLRKLERAVKANFDPNQPRCRAAIPTADSGPAREVAANARVGYYR